MTLNITEITPNLGLKEQIDLLNQFNFVGSPVVWKGAQVTICSHASDSGRLDILDSKQQKVSASVHELDPLLTPGMQVFVSATRRIATVMNTGIDYIRLCYPKNENNPEETCFIRLKTEWIKDPATGVSKNKRVPFGLTTLIPAKIHEQGAAHDFITPTASPEATPSPVQERKAEASLPHSVEPEQEGGLSERIASILALADRVQDVRRMRKQENLLSGAQLLLQIKEASPKPEAEKPPVSGKTSREERYERRAKEQEKKPGIKKRATEPDAYAGAAPASDQASSKRRASAHPINLDEHYPLREACSRMPFALPIPELDVNILNQRMKQALRVPFSIQMGHPDVKVYLEGLKSERGLPSHLVCAQAPDIGWGIYNTGEFIPPGSFIGFYTGTIRPVNSRSNADNTFFYNLWTSLPPDIKKQLKIKDLRTRYDLVVDATKHRNFTACMNHGRGKNANVVSELVLLESSEWGNVEIQIGLFAGPEGIQPRHQCLHDYSSAYWEDKGIKPIDISPADYVFQDGQVIRQNNLSN